VILAGIAVSAVSAASLALALALAPKPVALVEIIFWLLGGLQDRTLLHARSAAPPILLGALILVRPERGVDPLNVGHGTAASLGVLVGRTLRLAALDTAPTAGQRPALREASASLA
jgi:iron complex transport system permease protein